MHFALLFCLSSFGFAFFFSNLGWVIFGPSLSLFATWTESFVTMTRIALGEFDSIYPLMVELNDTAAFVIVATYQVMYVVCHDTEWMASYVLSIACVSIHPCTRASR